MINKDDSFWQGYKRTDSTHDSLMLALDHALMASKSERLGQLLVNLMPKKEATLEKIEGSRHDYEYTPPSDLATWLFNIYDEDLIKLLLSKR